MVRDQEVNERRVTFDGWLTRSWWELKERVWSVLLCSMSHTHGVSSGKECGICYCFLHSWCELKKTVWAQEDSVKLVTLLYLSHTPGVSSRRECQACYFDACLTHSWCELKTRVWSVILCCMSHTRDVSSRKECEVCYFVVCLTLVVWAQDKSMKLVTLLYVSHSWCELRKRVWSVLLCSMSHTHGVSTGKECGICYCFLHSWCELRKSVWSLLVFPSPLSVSSGRQCEACYFVVSLTYSRCEL